MESKKNSEILLVGKLMGFFFGVIGLFVAFIYPQGSDDRKHFIQGWTAGFIASLIIGVVVLLGIFLFLV